MDAPVAATATKLASLDWIVLLGYLIVTIAIGWWSMRQISDAGGFLMARRKLGKVLSLAATFSGGVNASDPVQVTSKVYKDGVSGVWTALNFLLLTPWFWIRDPVGRRLRLVTGNDVMLLRYGPVLFWLSIITGLIGGIFGLGLGIKAAALVTEQVSGGGIGMGWAVALVVVPTLLYTVMGGIIAACATDVFMSLLIVVLSFIAIPYAWQAVGGLTAIHNGMPASHFDLISAAKGSDFTIWGIIWFMITWIINLTPGPSGAKDEMTARIGGLGLIFKRFCTIGWAVLGLLGVLIYAKTGVDAGTVRPDEVFARICTDILPSGLRGLMVAAILAAAMSTIAAMAIGFSGMCLHNLWRPLVKPQATPGHYLLMARVFAALSLVLAWVVAVSNKDDIFSYFTKIALLGSLMGVCTLAAYMWRSATTAGALASIVAIAPSVIIALVTSDLTQPWAHLDGIRSIWVGWLRFLESGYAASGVESVRLSVDAAGSVIKAPLAISAPATIIPGIVALVVVSIMTKQHNPRDVEEFYARLDTPVGDEHLLTERGIKVDLLQDLGSDADVTTRDPSRRLLFLDLLYLPSLLWSGRAKISDYKIDLIGGALCTAFVAAFIGALLWGISLLKAG